MTYAGEVAGASACYHASWHNLGLKHGFTISFICIFYTTAEIRYMNLKSEEKVLIYSHIPDFSGNIT